MSETTSANGASPSSGITTGDQHRKNEERRKNNERADQDRSASPPNDGSRKKDRDKDTNTRSDTFKSKIEKMGGHVFQLTKESKKGNQFTKTMEALHDYVNIKLDHPKDLSGFFEEQCSDVVLTPPQDEPPKSVSVHSRQFLEWKFACTTYNERLFALNNNKLKIFTVALAQCSPSVKTKIESTPGYNEAKNKYDCHWLITHLRNISHRFKQTKSRHAALWDAKDTIFNLKQGPNQSVTEYYHTFKEAISVLESYGGILHDQPRSLAGFAHPQPRHLGKTRPEYARLLRRHWFSAQLRSSAFRGTLR